MGYMGKIDSVELVVKAIGAEVGSKYHNKLTTLTNRYRSAISNFRVTQSVYPKGLDKELFESVFLRGMRTEEADSLRSAYQKAGSSINLPDDVKKRFYSALAGVASPTWMAKVTEVKQATTKYESQKEKVRQAKQAIINFRKADDPAFSKTIRRPQKYQQVSYLDVASRMQKELGDTYAQAYLQKVEEVRDALNKYGQLAYGTPNFADTPDALEQLIPAYTQTAAHILSLHQQRKGAPLEASDGKYDVTPEVIEQRREAGRASGEKRRQAAVQEPAAQPTAPKRRGRNRVPTTKTSL